LIQSFIKIGESNLFYFCPKPLSKRIVDYYKTL
jgi:hypothetical protein